MVMESMLAGGRLVVLYKINAVSLLGFFYGQGGFSGDTG